MGLLALVGCAVLVIVVFYYADIGEKSYATPKEAFEASRAALEKKDMRAWCQCMTEDSRDFIAASMVIQEFKTKQQQGKNPGNKAAQIRAVDAVFAEYGLTEEFLISLQDEASIIDRFSPAPMTSKLRFARRVVKPIGNRCAFVSEMFDAVLKGSGGENPLLVRKDDKLGDVKITDKTAAGTITSPGGGIELIFFRLEENGWRIDEIKNIESEAPAPGGGRHPGGFQHP
jgi:hypothetical protein